MPPYDRLPRALEGVERLMRCQEETRGTESSVSRENFAFRNGCGLTMQHEMWVNGRGTATGKLASFPWQKARTKQKLCSHQRPAIASPCWIFRAMSFRRSGVTTPRRDLRIDFLIV